MPRESTLLALLSAVTGGLIVAFANHQMTRRRELEKKSSELNIEFLIDCWTKIDRAARIGDDVPIEEINERYSNLEMAIARIMLIGNKKEIEAAKLFAVNLASGQNRNADDLLNSLRDSLRQRLGLERTEALGLFFRMQRRRD